MVIITAKCKRCPQTFRENGEYKFKDALEYHYSKEHNKELEIIKKLQENAEKELLQLKNKYPELYLSFGFFNIHNGNFVEGK